MIKQNTIIDMQFVSILFLVMVTSVYCKLAPSSAVRLKGGSGQHEGHIQILLNNQWRYICPNNWDMRDAKVVCRQLNYTKALRATEKAYFPVKNVTYWLDSVQCWGSETDVNYCWHRKYGKHNCKDDSQLAGVVCSNETENEIRFPIPSAASGEKGAEMKVRLNGNQVDGFTNVGYLEVFFDGLWGNVCADDWTEENSFVACGHLGYPDFEAFKSELRVEQPLDLKHYWMKNVKCAGTESTLYECDHAGWKRHVCKNNRAVHLKCKRSPLLVGNRFDKALMTEYTARLRAGSSHSEGRVEIFHQNRWGTICDDGWDIKAANIFCRMAGFGTAFEAVHYAMFGQGVGKVWMDQINCTGTERNVTECKHQGWGKGDCGHAEDAGVRCHFPYRQKEQQIRLFGGDEMSGRVEVLSNGQWKGICGIGWGLREAQVVCRQAGLGYPNTGFATAKFGLTSKLAMHSVKCSGDELEIQHCFFINNSARACGPWMAAVKCSRTAPDLVTDYRQMKKSIIIQSKPLFDLTCAYEEGCLSSDASNYIQNPHYFERLLLRFTSRMYNRGTEDFLPFQTQDKWEWHSCHNHYHSMERFSDHDLIDASGLKKAEGHKASFCLEDSICDRGIKQIFNCENDGAQGISVNCADNYKWDVDCQWVDMTTVAYGKYTLRVTLNPLLKVFESDYSNNIVSCGINYKSETQVFVDDCKVDTCEQMSHGGTGNGACCHFPFIYKGKQHRTCTTAGFKGHSVLWCATTGNYDEDKRWGHCRPI